MSVDQTCKEQTMSDPTVSVRRKLALAGITVGLAAALAVPIGVAQAAPKDSRFDQVNVVSDLPGVAAIQDPLVQNAWGLALSPTSPVWVANNGSGTATLYSGNGVTTPFAKVPLTVTITNGAPTGQVFNGGSSFVVGSPPAGGPARFIFESQVGDVTGWNPAAAPPTALVGAQPPAAANPGLGPLQPAPGPFP